MTNIVNQARIKQRSVVITLVDLRNAFGEVHHNLIKSVLDYHHIPKHVTDIIKSLYTDFHTATNGQAERIVQILKSAIAQARVTVNVVLARSLLVYRNTSHTTTGETPSVLLMGRKLRTFLDLLLPSVEEHVKKQQYKVLERNGNRNIRSFTKGQNVFMRNYQGKEKWIRGEITEVLGLRHYMAKVPGGVWRRHVDQLLKDDTQVAGKSELDDTEISSETSTSPVTEKLPETSDGSGSTSDIVTGASGDDSPARDNNCNPDVPEPATSDAEAVGRRYPLRMNRGRPRQQTE